MKFYYFALLCLLMMFSCHRDHSLVKVFRGDTTSRPHKTKAPTWRQMLTEDEKDRQIYNAYEISKDTIVLLRRSMGIEISTNGGKKWNWMGKDIEVNEFTVDNKGIWWSLDRWKGIHEASYCRVHKSADLGKTWQTYVMNTNVFFPYHIYSKPRQPLEVKTWDNKVYLLSGDDPTHHWRFIKQIPEANWLADISVNNYGISRENDDNKLYVKRKNGETDTLFHFTKAYNIYQMEKIGNVIYVAGPDTTGFNDYFATITNERDVEEYTVPGGDLNIYISPLNHIFLMSGSGAFMFKNKKIIQIYK